MTERIDKGTVLVLLVVAVLVFVGVFYLTQSNARCPLVYGVRVCSSSDPAADIRGVIGTGPVQMWISASDETVTIPCKQVASVEIAATLGSLGKQVNVVGRVADSYCINANRTRVDCGSPQIIVQDGPANAVSIRDSVVIEGSEAWFCDNSVPLRNIVRYALSG